MHTDGASLICVGFTVFSLYVYPVTRKRVGPFRAGRVLQPQISKLDHGGQCRTLLVSNAKAKGSTVYFVRSFCAKHAEKDRRERASFWRTASVCHFAPLFYLAQCNLPNTKIYSRHIKTQSKFTLHTHVHTHTQGDYSHSLRSQTISTFQPFQLASAKTDSAPPRVGWA